MSHAFCFEVVWQCGFRIKLQSIVESNKCSFETLCALCSCDEVLRGEDTQASQLRRTVILTHVGGLEGGKAYCIYIEYKASKSGQNTLTFIIAFKVQMHKLDRLLQCM